MGFGGRPYALRALHHAAQDRQPLGALPTWSCSASQRIFHASMRLVVIWFTGSAPNSGSR
jgi:hypothetical protein